MSTDHVPSGATLVPTPLAVTVPPGARSLGTTPLTVTVSPGTICPFLGDPTRSVRSHPAATTIRSAAATAAMRFTPVPPLCHPASPTRGLSVPGILTGRQKHGKRQFGDVPA